MRYYSHYSKWHNHNDQQYVEFMKTKFRNTFAHHLPQSRGADILEIGCANGMALLTLREMGFTNLLGIELDEELATIAKSFGLNVEILDATKFVFETDRRFDFIYMFDVLEHFDPEIIPVFLYRLFNLLNRDGKLMLVVPNATSPAGSYFRYIDWTHRVSFTPTSMSHLLEEVGFKNISIEDESLIPEPRTEDFDSETAYYHAKNQSDRARFYESFVRWEMKSMFGDDQFNMIVAPNMKVVAKKIASNNIDIKVLSNNQVFDLKEYVEKSSLFESKLEQIRMDIEDLQATVIEVTDLKEKANSNSIRLEALTVNTQELNSQLEILKSNVITIKGEIHAQNLGLIKIEKYMGNIFSKIMLSLERVEDFNNTIPQILQFQNRKKLFKRLLMRLSIKKQYKMIIQSGYFDTDFYLREYPDVRNSGIDPIRHYLLYGAFEGRDPSSNFCTIGYLRNNPELLIEGRQNPLVHKILSERNLK